MALDRGLETPSALPAGFRAVWERLGPPPHVLLAVSGGADSMALMRLAAPFHRDGLARIDVATVDHGLRQGSREEAAFVGREARALGLAHAVLDWRGDKPATGVQAAARAARYRLLIAHAQALGAGAILAAHTADDQAETVFMRQQRGAGPRGLAGIAETTMIAAGASDPLPLLRPLLGARRRVLRAFLEASGAPFIDDPSNDDPAFERVRARRLLQALEADGALTVAALNEAAAAARAAARRLEEAENARFAALGGAFDERGCASLRSAALGPGDAPLAARLVQAVAGGDYAPAEARAGEALAAALSGRLATLGGAMLGAEEGRLIVWREPAAVLGRAGTAPLAPALLAAGERVLWDGRFIVRNPFEATARLVPLGEAAAAALAGSVRESGILAAAPCLMLGGELAAVAGDGEAFRPLAEERFFQRVNRYR